MTKARKIAYGIILGLVAVLLVLGGLFDKVISDTVYQPNNFMANIFESAGIFTPFIFVSATFVVLFFLVKAGDRYRALKKALCAAASVISYLIYGFMASETYLDPLWARAIVAVGTALVLTPLTFLFFRNKTEERLRRYSIFLIFASIVCVISSLLTINVLKFIWGRPRYREMMADGDVALSPFTPWYHINGFSLHGHHSFPSGHTCSAANLLVLLALEEVFPDAREKKKTLALVVGIYIFTMAYSRIVLGAHFLSDVTAGFFIGFITYAVARYIYFDKSRAVVTAILSVEGKQTETPCEEEENSVTSVTEDRMEIPLDACVAEESEEDFRESVSEAEETAESKESTSPKSDFIE